MTEPRVCGSCTLCCKLFPVPELEKSASRWCRHVVQGKGCGIHETRPDVCRAFWCQWIENAELGPEWKPEKSRFVLSIYPGTNSLAVTVDPATPTAWRDPRYLASLQRWAAAALAQGNFVLVFVGEQATAILPNGDQPLGTIRPGDQIVSRKRGPFYDVEVRRG